MEIGFFHSSRGYWQTTNEPPQHILDNYPAGTVEVPLKPFGDHEWIGGKWELIQPDPEDVRAEIQAAIMIERDRRMRSTLAFGGDNFDIDQGSLQRITGAATLAGFALGQGAQAGDLFWHGGADPFGWITADNQIVTMDAPTVFAFGQAAANHESQHIFAARALKDMDPIPDDWAHDQWWP